MDGAAVVLAAAAALAALAGRPGAAQDPAPAAPAAPPVEPGPAREGAAASAVPGLDTITAAELRAHVTTLAADDMKGRDVRSGGIELAAAYVRDQMKAAGLAPAGTAGDWYHTFTLGRIERDPNGQGLSCGETTLAAADGWLALAPANGTWSGRLVPAGDGSDAAFARAGAAEGGLAGAWLVVRSDRSLVQRDTADALAALAARAGALGALGVLHVPAADTGAGQWRFIAGFLGRSRHGTAADIVAPPAPLAVWCERAALDRLLGAAAAAALLAREPFVPDPPGAAPVTVTLTAAATLADAVTYRNVCGRLAGADPALAPEHVAFSAHYDHIGTRQVPEGRDGIFNGADDDASGVAAILELAQAFAAAPPKRSVLVIAFTGEEQGLLGSKAWSAAPTVPLGSIVADFNIEMIGRPAAGGPGHLWITGYERSTLGALVAEAAAPHGVTAGPDPYPAMGFFMRSDNFSLARHGVPAHSFSSFDPLTHHDYHGPGDHADKCDFENMQTLVRGIYAAARRMADGGATPRWAEGDPLGARR